MKILAHLSMALMFLALFEAKAFARVNSTHEIRGFHFTSCDENHCVEAWSDKGFISQLQFGFTTSGPTVIRLTSTQTKMSKELKGTSSTYHPKLDILTLESDEATTLVSLKDLSTETFLKAAKTETKK